MTSFQTPPVPRLAQLTDLLWTGGALSHRVDAATHAVKFWQSVGIRAVVDTRLEWTDDELIAEIAPEIAFLNEGVVDGGQPMRDSWFDNITDFAVRHLDSGGGVLIHCGSGINRGPSAAFAVLLRLGWDPVDAIELIRTQRPAATVSYGEGALDWWQRKAAVPVEQRHDDRKRFDEWRAADRARRFEDAQRNVNSS